MPLASLVGFVIVPARHRIVYHNAVGFAETVFIRAFLHLVVPWALRTEIGQGVMKGIQQGLEAQKDINADIEAMMERAEARHRPNDEL